LLIYLGFIINKGYINEKSEKMKVVKYSQFKLIESMSDREYDKMLNVLDNRLYEMKYLGADSAEINEGLWDILGGLGDGVTDRLKNYAAGWLLDKFGLPSDNVFLSEWVKNIVEQVSFKHIGNYFGSGSCKYWIEAISKGLLETVEEKALSLLLQKMGYDVNFTNGIGGTVIGSIREALTNTLNDTNFINNLAQKLDGTICGSGTSFSTVFGGGKFSEKDLKKAAVASGAPEKGGKGILGSIMGEKPSGEGKFDASSFWSMLGI